MRFARSVCILPAQLHMNTAMKPYLVVLGLVCLLLQGVSARDWLESLGALFKGSKGNGSQASPWFCHGLDCPRYEVVEQFDDIELRKYETGLWASTTINDPKYEPAVYQGFMRLFKYISGENEAGSKIEMTAPVRTKVYPSQGPFCGNNFTVSFFVPFDYQASGPPAPTSSDISIEEAPAMSVYVASYGGYASDKDILAHARSLVEKLEAAGKAYKSEHYFSAGYDSPFRLIGRHNEVWVMADSGKEQQ